MYLPLPWGYRRLGDKHFRTVEGAIEKFNLQFDIIHAHFSWSAGYVGAKLKEKYDLPLVITVYENQKWFIEEYESGNEDLYWAWEMADTLLRLNQADIPLLERFNSSVMHMPIGYDSAKFYPIERAKARKHLSLPSDREILFSLGFLKEKKGFRFLIDAMNYIADCRDDTICFIGGGGPLRNDLQRQIENLELNDRVKLIGYLDHEGEDIRHWYNACDLFVLPSLSESFGVVQVEAMACGKPVVATFNGGSETVIQSEKHGYLTDAGNSRALADTILSALNKDWDETEILGYARQYAWENITEAITDIYSDLLKAHA
jgi:glycosyltransferase involved in cell wall biosynthesis